MLKLLLLSRKFLPKNLLVSRKAMPIEREKWVRKNPVIFVIGCTGTGKSDMGVDIAVKYGGEVISADSMQIYKGLDIATNKITTEEAKGVPHHLMSFIEPSSTAQFHVQQFREKCLQTIDEIRERGKIPIIVGGTTYYVESVMYEGTFIDTPVSSSNTDLDSMTKEQLYAELERVDPESAKLVHANNRARVRRAIEVVRLTGSKKSEIINQQKERLRYPESLVLFLDASLEVLDARLDKRVGKMQTNGLREEIEEFYDKNQDDIEACNFGVMQCIGLKEFMPYLQLPKEERRTEKGDKLFTGGCEQVQLRTRQYSRKQRRWVTSRLIRQREGRPLPSVSRVDTSDPKTFMVNGMKVFEEWLQGKQFSEKDEQEAEPAVDANLQLRCDVCEITVSGKRNYEAHLSGNIHKRKAMAKKRGLEEKAEGESDSKKAKTDPKEPKTRTNGTKHSKKAKEKRPLETSETAEKQAEIEGSEKAKGVAV